MYFRKNVNLFFRHCLPKQFLSNKCLLHTQLHPLQAGHSKWANIKHIKALKDGQRSDLFAKLARQIRLAVQEGGSPVIEKNLLLRQVVDIALKKNMPLATVQANIKRSQLNKDVLKKQQIHLKYKQGIFMVVIVYTDNLAGFRMTLSSVLRKFNASMIDDSRIFEDYGLIEAELTAVKDGQIKDLEDRVTDDAINSGAEDVEVEDAAVGLVNFKCDANHLSPVRRQLEEKGYAINNAEHIFVANQLMQLSPEELDLYNGFLSRLKAIQGVEDIYDNIQCSEK